MFANTLERRGENLRQLRFFAKVLFGQNIRAKKGQNWHLSGAASLGSNWG